MGSHSFTADQVATWLEEANGSRRARWIHWPDATALAADLSEIDFTVRFTPPHITVRQVHRVAGLLRKVAAALDDPRLTSEAQLLLLIGRGLALYRAQLDDTADATEHQRRLALALRLINLEKPAHTIFDAKFYWASFRVGEARLGDDTIVDLGSRAPQFLTPMVLGKGYLSENYLAPGHPYNVTDRQVIGRDRLNGSTTLS